MALGCEQASVYRLKILRESLLLTILTIKEKLLHNITTTMYYFSSNFLMNGKQKSVSDNY